MYDDGASPPQPPANERLVLLILETTLFLPAAVGNNLQNHNANWQPQLRETEAERLTLSWDHLRTRQKAPKRG